MKKLLFVAFATFMCAFVSCNTNATTESTEVTDSIADSTVVVDSAAVDAPVEVADSVVKE